MSHKKKEERQRKTISFEQRKKMVSRACSEAKTFDELAAKSGFKNIKSFEVWRWRNREKVFFEFTGIRMIELG